MYLDFEMYLDFDGLEPPCISTKEDADDATCAEPLSCGAAEDRNKDIGV